MDNFDFLKTVDKDLYDIINDAEKLYRDEYFEQCIGQTRRFGEVVCKNVLGRRRNGERTLDDMLATLKDNATHSVQEKEFIEDLYFLKREGNASVHASSVKKDGIVALECLQRAFEISISYAVYYQNADSKLLKRRYDTKLLVTGKKTEQTLAEKYAEEKAFEERGVDIRTKNKPTKKKTKKKEATKREKQSHVMKPSKKASSKLFWSFVGISAVISLVLVLTIYLLSLV